MQQSKKPRVAVKYLDSDISTIIAERLADLVSEGNVAFKTLQPSPGMIILTIGTQKFLISITDHKKLS